MPQRPFSDEQDALEQGLACPVSALFHEHTKLTERSILEWQEPIRRASAVNPTTQGKTYPTRPTVTLETTKRRSLFSPKLSDSLTSRRSRRSPFSRSMLPASTLGPLLQQALGPTQGARRAYPSAGALYPLEFYLAARTCEGVPQAMYHFDPLRHVLANIAPLPTDALFMRLVFAETPTCNLLENAAVVLIMTAVFDRTQTKYGERGYRFALLEAGHAAQNVLLCATAAGLDAVPLGGFCEDALGEALGLDARQESPLHVLLLGTR